jgi:hypothetical protein
MNLGASAVQVEVGTGRILSMVQNRPFSIGRCRGQRPTTQVNYNVRAENGGGGGHSAGSTYKVFSLVNWLEQGHSVNETLNGRVGTKKVDQLRRETQDVVAGNNGNGIGNFENNSGYVGTVYNFTRDSLNSGFLAMAEKISVCSTNQVAMKMGVMTGTAAAGHDELRLQRARRPGRRPIDMAGPMPRSPRTACSAPRRRSTRR